MNRTLPLPSFGGDAQTVAFVYVRVSKFEPRDEGRKVSPQTQLEKCKALLALHGLAVEVFEDKDFSGKTTRRPAFQRMLGRARRGDVAVVACYSVSRLSRSVADLYTVLQQLQEQGVGFVSATEPIETATPMGKAFLGILAVLAQLEREQTSQRVTDALAYKRTQGRLLGSLPAGFKREPDGAIVVDEAIAATLRLVFETYASGGFSYKTLAYWLNERGVKTIARRGGNGRTAGSPVVGRRAQGSALAPQLHRPRCRTRRDRPGREGRAARDRQP
jgi:site-specific DNA recombinase